ncbi:50S ribosomal protein L9 [Candidatus Nomurabacteria bacterium]|nr:50S ribosomal protein L9 [Candidatus Nomurabacteria bacterium]
MKVIFLKDVPRVGKRHDVKEVNDGYAANFLFPNKLAEMATPKAVANLEQRKKEIVMTNKIQEDLLLKNLEEIKNKIINIKGKANEKGSLFSSIHKKDIIDALKSEHRAEINEEFIVLEKPIKEVGEYEIPIQIKGKKSSFKLVVQKV